MPCKPEEVKKGRRVKVEAYGVIARDGLDNDGEVGVKIEVEREGAPPSYFEPHQVTVLPDPIEAGDIVRGAKWDSGRVHCGEVHAFIGNDICFKGGTVIRRRDARLVCSKADRKDI